MSATIVAQTHSLTVRVGDFADAFSAAQRAGNRAYDEAPDILEQADAYHATLNAVLRSFGYFGCTCDRCIADVLGEQDWRELEVPA